MSVPSKAKARPWNQLRMKDQAWKHHIVLFGCFQKSLSGVLKVEANPTKNASLVVLYSSLESACI
jgi:hypothetical protein